MEDKWLAARSVKRKSTAQIWVVTRHQYGISELVGLRRHFAGKPVVASPNVGCFSDCAGTVDFEYTEEYPKKLPAIRK